MNEYYNERACNNRYARVQARNRSILIKRRLVMIAIFLFVTLAFIISIHHFTYANDQSNNMNKRYKSVMLYCGETLDNISAEYDRYGYSSEIKFKHEICSINSITEDTTLIAGNYLILPYFEGN